MPGIGIPSNWKGSYQERPSHKVQSQWVLREDVRDVWSAVYLLMSQIDQSCTESFCFFSSTVRETSGNSLR